MTERTPRRSCLSIVAVIGVWLVLWAVLLMGIYSYGRENYVFC
jgi:hypothetical protein